METPRLIDELQSVVTNPLPRDLAPDKKLAAVIGENPSSYSKSPALWNAAFGALGLNAIYLPLDVDSPHLAEVVRLLRACPDFLGASVTVPHKLAILPLLDEIDSRARRIGAVNTVVRTQNGRLKGYNTDGEGFLEAVVGTPGGACAPLLPSSTGARVLLIGAGGAARAVAFSLADSLRGGLLILCNRTAAAAASLARELASEACEVRAISEEELDRWLERVDLIVNCSLRGQGGFRAAADCKLTTLEPYSALAPANPAAIAPGGGDVWRAWLAASLPDVLANQQLSLRRALAVPLHAGFYDSVYFPEETVFLRHGRWSGHRTLNGRSMIIAQAARALFDHVCRESLRREGRDDRETYRGIVRAMEAAWHSAP